jgi:hypothetical protein
MSSTEDERERDEREGWVSKRKKEKKRVGFDQDKRTRKKKKGAHKVIAQTWDLRDVYSNSDDSDPDMIHAKPTDSRNAAQHETNTGSDNMRKWKEERLKKNFEKLKEMREQAATGGRKSKRRRARVLAR